MREINTAAHGEYSSMTPFLQTGDTGFFEAIMAGTGLGRDQLNRLVDQVEITEEDLHKHKLLRREWRDPEAKAMNNRIRKMYGVPTK